ncbi:MAG: Gfo/Idh/MocA family oxidoreductase [Dehalococcoidia bacterium]|nr:Gfo/Idh/MocA family oxidoreductase [Dehalococcoidia bacterium]
MTAEQVLKVGIVGCGQMGRKHAMNCRRVEGVAVVAVADVREELARKLADEVNASPYTSADEMMAAVRLDALIVGTPPTVRKGPVEAAAAAGAAVFVEKPLALDLATAKAMSETVRHARVVNAVGFHLRYSPLTQRARALVAGQRVTHVRTATTTSYYLNLDCPPWFLQRRHSGGPLFEQSLHVLDAARYLVGDVVRVFARGERLIRPDLQQFDSEDTMVLAYQFASGAMGTHVDSCAMKEFNWEVELFGPTLRLLVDYARSRLHGHVDGKPVDEDAAGLDLHALEMQRFLAAVRGRDPSPVLSDFADAAKTIAVLQAGDTSLKTAGWERVQT